MVMRLDYNPKNDLGQHGDKSCPNLGRAFVLGTSFRISVLGPLSRPGCRHAFQDLYFGTSFKTSVRITS